MDWLRNLTALTNPHQQRPNRKTMNPFRKMILSC